MANAFHTTSDSLNCMYAYTCVMFCIHTCIGERRSRFVALYRKVDVRSNRYISGVSVYDMNVPLELLSLLGGHTDILIRCINDQYNR